MAELTREVMVIAALTDRQLRNFYAKVLLPDSNGCTLWANCEHPSQYGRLSVSILGEQVRLSAHRLSYTLGNGMIPVGLQLDHLCRIPACVRPCHLEPVTIRENLLRSPLSWATKNTVKSECDARHPFDDANTYWRADGRRACKECNREASRRHYARRKVMAS